MPTRFDSADDYEYFFGNFPYTEVRGEIDLWLKEMSQSRQKETNIDHSGGGDRAYWFYQVYCKDGDVDMKRRLIIKVLEIHKSAVERLIDQRQGTSK
ncbi:MAG: hypothetical protein IH840_14565 [Candidatus Heimdallarchaeota archaeon]|nr:hypothetical protein [Candidatus Heimdallarchaeota archaeon]